MGKKKKIPKDGKEILDAIQQGNMDRRCAVARQIINTRKCISENVKESIKAIITNSISINCQIQDQILKEIQGQNIIADGRVDKLVTQDLLTVQRSLIANCSLLAHLEGVVPSPKAIKRKEENAKDRYIKTVSDVVLEVNGNISFNVNDTDEVEDADSD